MFSLSPSSAVSLILLLFLSPVLAFASIGIFVFGGDGPLLYRSLRVGLGGEEFTILKFRSMRSPREGEETSKISGVNDARVYGFGRFLRVSKVDELPQLFNILKGEMTFIGPRPENPEIVREHYTDYYKTTFKYKPGLVSPGSLYNYTHGHLHLDEDDQEYSYVSQLLPLKIQLEVDYFASRTAIADSKLIIQTLCSIVRLTLGGRFAPRSQ